MITSTSNQRIKEARKLLRKRQRQASGQLLIEGTRLVGDALAAGVAPTLVFFDAEAVQSNAEVAALLSKMSQSEQVPCAPHVFAALADTVSPQGIAAIVPLPDLDVAPTPQPLVLVLDRVRDPGNAGTLLRTAEAAGVSLALFGPKTVDPFNPKAVRAAMGAHFRLPLRSGEWPLLQDELERMQPPTAFSFYVAEADAPLRYDAVDWCAPSVLVVGGEAAGPSKTAALLATPLAIPMLGGTESLNAGVAGAVILFEAARQRRINISPEWNAD